MPFNHTDILMKPQTRLIQLKNSRLKVGKTPLFSSLRLYPCFYYVKSSTARAAQGAKGKQELEIRAVLYNIYFLSCSLLTAKVQGSDGGSNKPLSA
ncbi:MAG: hypothetical protein ACPG5H_09405 [Cycloclasticus pugetii]